MARKILCLDWDKRYLRMVVARLTRGGAELEDAHRHRVPTSVDADDATLMGGFIQQMLKRHGWSYRHVAVDVSRESAVINRLVLPPTPAEELAGAVRFQAMRELPFPLERAEIDFVVTRRDDKKLATEVLLAGVEREKLAQVRQTCTAAGLSVDRVGLRPYSNLVSVTRLHGANGQRLLFVDVGPVATEIDIIAGGVLAFSRSANVQVPVTRGGEGAVEDSRILTIAEISEMSSSDEAIEAAVKELLTEVTRTIQAYRATEPDAAIEKIVVAGGTGLESSLLTALDKRFGLPAELYDPTAVLKVDAARAGELRSFSAALGLAWGAGTEGLLEIDFLHPKRPVPKGQTLRQRMRVAAVAAVLLVVSLAAVYARYYFDKAGQVTALQKDIDRLKKQRREQLAFVNKVDEVHEWQFDPIWVDHLKALTETAVDEPKNKQILVDQVKFDAGAATAVLSNVRAVDWSNPLEWEKRLNELSVDGRRAYVAALGRWNKDSEGTKYSSRGDLAVVLAKYRQYLDGARKRVNERRDRLKGL